MTYLKFAVAIFALVFVAGCVPVDFVDVACGHGDPAARSSEHAKGDNAGTVYVFENPELLPGQVYMRPTFDMEKCNPLALDKCGHGRGI